MRQELASVISNDEVMPDAHLIWLESPIVAAAVLPGQFVMVKCGEGCLLRRPLSVHQVTGTTRIALLFTVVGKGTRWLSRRKAGDSIDLLGPLGNGFSIDPVARNLLLVAGGIGVAPICFLAQQTLSQGCSVTLLYGTANRNRYPAPPGIKLVAATEDGTVGHQGMITDLLPDFIDRADQIFACGPTSMYRAIQNQRLLNGKPAQVSLEVRMGCGLGVCYGCTVKTKNGLKQVCQDGPVFNLEDILW